VPRGVAARHSPFCSVWSHHARQRANIHFSEAIKPANLIVFDHSGTLSLGPAMTLPSTR